MRLFVSVKTRAGVLWIGTPNGLNKFDRSARNRSLIITKGENEGRNLSNNYVQSLYEDSAGALWIGMIDGSAAFDAERKTHLSGSIRCRVSLYDSFAEGKDGRILAATPQDILEYDRRPLEVRRRSARAARKNSRSHIAAKLWADLFGQGRTTGYTDSTHLVTPRITISTMHPIRTASVEMQCSPSSKIGPEFSGLARMKASINTLPEEIGSGMFHGWETNLTISSGTK